MKNIISTFICSFLIPTIVLVLSNPASAQQFAVIDGETVAFGTDSGDLWNIKRKVAPNYPMKALRKELEGCVAVGYLINSNGKTSDHRILAESASGVFNDSAIEAARKFYYTPSEENPEKTSVLTFNTFTYQIGDREKAEKSYKELSEVCSSAAKQALQPLLWSSEEG